MLCCRTVTMVEYFSAPSLSHSERRQEVALWLYGHGRYLR
jgi:hypothetical protein